MRLQAADVFAKTAEEARIRTRGGGIVTLAAAVVIVWLLLLEIKAYATIEFNSSLVIDTTRGEELPIELDITFSSLPCDLLSVDSMDDNGNVQEDLIHKLELVDLDGSGQVRDPAIRERQTREREEAIARRGPDYDGGCYGAEDAAPNGKCMTCADVREAYARKNWQFHDGHGFAQCVEERYPDHIAENRDSGCRVSGRVTVAKTIGKLHFAPGHSYFANNQHSHDLSTYNLQDLPYNFAHTIHRLSFGDRELGNTLVEDPLQGHEARSDIKHYVFRYFLKVVATDVVFRNGTTVATNQYSATWHGNPLAGGRDDDHPHSFHRRGGMPGTWIEYDISPMKVINAEVRKQEFGQLLMNVFAIVGAVVTTGAVVDRGVYAVNRALLARKAR